MKQTDRQTKRGTERQNRQTNRERFDVESGFTRISFFSAEFFDLFDAIKFLFPPMKNDSKSKFY